MTDSSTNPRCACGCGEQVNRAKHNYPNRGIEKGDPFKFLRGHHLRGPNHHSWNGGRTVTNGYVRVLQKDHPRADDAHGCVYEHILVAEKALGAPLPDEAEVHHVDGDGTNNDPSNLVICENHSYHFLLEKRSRALRACGHADWLCCTYCKSWGAPDEMKPDGEASKHYHPSCQRAYDRRRNRGGAT